MRNPRFLSSSFAVTVFKDFLGFSYMASINVRRAINPLHKINLHFDNVTPSTMVILCTSRIGCLSLSQFVVDDLKTFFTFAAFIVVMYLCNH